jgi:predicted nucleic-acid-binding protein
VKVTLDTSVLVRLATQDHPAQAEAALQVLRRSSLIAVPTPAVCELVWVLMRGSRYSAEQVAQAVRMLMGVRQVVCNTPAALAGLTLLESGGDFADGAIAYEGGLLCGQAFVSFDRQAAQLLDAQGRRVRWLNTG